MLQAAISHAAYEVQEREHPAPSSCTSVGHLLRFPLVAFHSDQQSIWYVHVADGARMEECLPGADYASVEDDQSKTDNPPAPCTPCPAGEQTQVEGERSQLLRPQLVCSQCKQDSHLVSHRRQASSGTTLLSSHTQPPGLSRAGEVTQLPSQSPQSKRKRVFSSTSGEMHMEVYHELPLSRTVPLDVVIYTTLWHGLVLLSFSNQSSS